MRYLLLAVFLLSLPAFAEPINPPLRCDLSGVEITDTKDMVFYEGDGCYLRVHKDQAERAEEEIEKIRERHKALLKKYKDAVKRDTNKLKGE